MYSIYKTTNTITGKFYVGKQHKDYDYYLGSGKLLRKAIDKHGKDNFTKTILEDRLTAKQASIREQYWIAKTGALGNQGYNMNEGGIGGDNSKHIDYANRKIKHNTSGLRAHWRSLTPEQRKQKHKEQGMARSKGWYVSKVNGTKETYVQNIAEWCDKHGIDKSMPTGLNNPNSRLFQKQTKGWRIRRSDMPKLKPYVNLRGVNYGDNCKNKTWRLQDGKRVWTTV
tara:strand:- start:89 stop:766 length:678 start_codon:yes stop_codon:yes gene_type:complete